MFGDRLRTRFKRLQHPERKISLSTSRLSQSLTLQKMNALLPAVTATVERLSLTSYSCRSNPQCFNKSLIMAATHLTS